MFWQASLGAVLPEGVYVPTGTVAFTIGDTSVCTAAMTRNPAVKRGSCTASNAPIGENETVVAFVFGRLSL